MGWGAPPMRAAGQRAQITSNRRRAKIMQRGLQALLWCMNIQASRLRAYWAGLGEHGL